MYSQPVRSPVESMNGSASLNKTDGPKLTVVITVNRKIEKMVADLKIQERKLAEHVK